MKRWLGVGLLGFALGAQAAPMTLSEGFGNLAASGWTILNASGSPGNPWFQGNAGVFSAHGGAANSYAGANFLATTNPTGPISLWLISPQLDFASQLLSFYARTESQSPFGDGLRVLVSGNGASTNPADFTTLFEINGANASGGFPDAWTLFSAVLLAAGSGRIAFEYFISDAMSANYIGLDTVQVVLRAVPEPATLLLAAAALGLAGVARRRSSARNA